jgi:hypothetical protein
MKRTTVVAALAIGIIDVTLKKSIATRKIDKALPNFISHFLLSLFCNNVYDKF